MVQTGSGARRAVIRQVLTGVAGLALASACASLPRVASPELQDRVRTAPSYSARLRLSLKGPRLRGRATVLVGFERPDRLRVEVPGPAGARLIAVARDGRLAAAFPGDRAFFEGAATPDALEALLGVGLSPEEMMDFLVGVPSTRLRSYTAGWGPSGPQRIDAALPDGARLKVVVESPELGPPIPQEAFADPPHEGYRSVDQEEARALWSPSGREASR